MESLLLYLGVVVVISILSSALTRFRMPPPGVPRTGYPTTNWPRTGWPNSGWPQESRPAVPAGGTPAGNSVGQAGMPNQSRLQRVNDLEGWQAADDPEGRSMMDTGPALTQEVIAADLPVGDLPIADPFGLPAPRAEEPLLGTGLLLHQGGLARAVATIAVLGPPRALSPWRPGWPER